jgi:hypothetical protein
VTESAARRADVRGPALFGPLADAGREPGIPFQERVEALLRDDHELGVLDGVDVVAVVGPEQQRELTEVVAGTEPAHFRAVLSDYTHEPGDDDVEAVGRGPVPKDVASRRPEQVRGVADDAQERSLPERIEARYGTKCLDEAVRPAFRGERSAGYGPASLTRDCR